MIRPSPSMVVASLALFVALSGTSYAVSQLPAKSVGTKQLKPNSVTGVKVKDGSLTARDFRAGDLPVGRVGPPGETGPAGPVGRRGPSASAFASAARSPGFPIPRGPGFTPMFSLTQFSDVTTGALSLDSGGRLMMTANITGQADSARFLVRFTCRLEVRDAQGWRPTVNEAQGWAGPNAFDSLSFAAVVDVDPGVVDVRVVCRSDDNERALFLRGHLAVIATDR